MNAKEPNDEDDDTEVSTPYVFQPLRPPPPAIQIEEPPAAQGKIGLPPGEVPYWVIALGVLAILLSAMLAALQYPVYGP